MEKINKRVKRKLKLMSCDNESNCVYLTPDLDVNYSFKFILKNKFIELGFFTPDLNSNVLGRDVENIGYNVTGYSNSRLSELKKYTPDLTLEYGYFLYDGSNDNGVDLENSSENIITYYLSGIKYVDNKNDNITRYYFERDNILNNNLNYLNKTIIKNENLEGVIDKPIINNRILIDRFNKRVLEDIYKFKDIDESKTLDTYGGNYFNIKRNT